MKTAKLLYGLGVLVLVLGVTTGIYSVLHLASLSATPNLYVYFSMILGPLWQGGLMMGIAKILERLYREQ